MTVDKAEKKPLNKFTGKKMMLFFIILLAFFVFIRIAIMPLMGQWLVVNDELKDSDVILVLMGSVYDRILEAVDFYQEGYGKQIVLINSYIAAKEMAREKGLKAYGNTLLCEMAARDMGVKEKDIVILDGNSRSTQDEARTFREYLKKNSYIDSVIIVTSKFHSRRAGQIFSKAIAGIDREIEILVRSSKYDDSIVERWWRSREGFEQVIFEYLKLGHFWLKERWEW